MAEEPIFDRFCLRRIRKERALSQADLAQRAGVVNQKVATRMLHSLGCDVEIAENGREALRMIQTSCFDLLFMDCQMPKLDGFQATGAIREWERRSFDRTGKVSRIPIVAMTANAMPGDRKKCLDAGMDDYISKPVKRSRLEDAVTR